MKKLAIPILVVALIASFFAGMFISQGKATAQTPQGSDSPAISDTPEQENGTSVNQLSQTIQSEPEKEIMTDAELLELFQMVYDKMKDIPLEGADKITAELDFMIDYVDSNCDKEPPSDYMERYIDWRPVEDDYVDERFTEVNEVVYATDTVNLRSETSVQSAKLSSMTRVLQTKVKP